MFSAVPRGPVFFFPPFRVALESYGTDTSASTSPLERYRVNLLAQNLPHLSRQRPEMPRPSIRTGYGPLPPHYRFRTASSGLPEALAPTLPAAWGCARPPAGCSSKQSPGPPKPGLPRQVYHVRALRLAAPLAAVAAERRLAQRDHFIGQPEGVAHGQALAAGVHGRRARGARRRALRQKL